MFYSHEVLTSRKYGVATVWLVATLGSKSSLKKVNRKAILEVNVPKACETILMPEAPMALRLQSNLLYGISRVYSQQCGYVLADAENAQHSIRALLKVVRTTDLDPEAGRGRPEQLLLEDDPSFLPDLALAPFDFDLSTFEASLTAESPLTSLSPHTPTTSSGTAFGGPVGGLVIPTSDTGAVGDIGGFIVPGDDGLGAAAAPGDDEGFLPEADFSFDAEGNLLDFSVAGAAPRPSVPGTGAAAGIGVVTAASARVRAEHAAGVAAGVPLGDQMDIDLPMIGDDNILPEGEAFPTAQRSPPAILRGSSLARETEAELSSEALEAQQARRPRAPRVIALDQSIELRHGDLARWNTDYLSNMQQAGQTKLAHRLPLQARKNAEFWVLGAGLGGIGARPTDGITNPLAAFAGAGLWEQITGQTLYAGTKRDRDSGIDTETEDAARRVRPRPSADDVFRGVGPEQDEGVITGFDDGDDDVELPREAPSALDDISSALPWNITASIRGSSVARAASTVRRGTLGRPSSVGVPGSLGRRIVSPSPLVGRGGPLPAGIEELDFGASDAFADLGDLGAAPPTGDDEFELYGPAAAVDTQTAGESQWQRAALDEQAQNFLTFIEAGIEGKRGRAADGGVEGAVSAEDVGEVSFEELLSPATNSRMVAAQALLHVLSLATKGLISIRQEEDFGEIGLGLVEV